MTENNKKAIAGLMKKLSGNPDYQALNHYCNVQRESIIEAVKLSKGDAYTTGILMGWDMRDKFGEMLEHKAENYGELGTD